MRSTPMSTLPWLKNLRTHLKKVSEGSWVLLRRVADRLKMLIRQNVWRTALFRRTAPFELLKIRNQDVKSRLLREA
jgi:hypothetical protein